MHRIGFGLFLACAAVSGCAQAPFPTHSAADAHRSWEHTQGGATNADAASPAARALARVAADLSGAPLHLSLLNTQSPVAFSFPDGNIYLSARLANTLPDDELAAVIAHELGHLLHDRILHPPAALRGNDASPSDDLETTADLLARQLLSQHHIPAAALAAALDRIAEQSRTTPFYASLHARAQQQHRLDAAP